MRSSKKDGQPALSPHHRPKAGRMMAPLPLRANGSASTCELPSDRAEVAARKVERVRKAEHGSGPSN